MAESNAEELGGVNNLGFSGKVLKNENSFTNRKDDFSDSRSSSKKQNKLENGFSDEFGLSTSASIGEKQVTTFFLLYASISCDCTIICW